ncbi:tRNA lysidine(34) synthetase TilS [Ilumatobacter sp.]|uniref:tRNA lysidine(34) synthetase TilS n=1 Tax=Ilumatobacter sp. TaxID=1967498 RepID=UPI003C3F701E
MSSEPARLTRELLARCVFPSTSPVTCALSGGPDSTALVALAVADGLEVTAAHVNHGHRPDADRDAAVAERIAHRLGVGFRCEHAELADGPNFEARARDARRALLGPDVLTGHTADDQAETVLLAMLRGSGATGLSAMRPDDRRPLLALRHAETIALCASLGLNPIEDASNRDPRFRRNRVRHELLTLANSIAERDTVPLLVRTADLLRTDDALLERLAGEIDPTDARALAAAPLALSRRAVRRWLTIDGYPPDAAAVERVLDVAAGSVSACEVAGVGRVRRSNQRLSIE